MVGSTDSLSLDEKIIYDDAFDKFAKGRTYQLTPHNELAERLRKEYALMQVKSYRHWSRYPVGHYFREEYDEVLGL